MKATKRNRYEIFPVTVGVQHFQECQELNAQILDEINAVDWDAYHAEKGIHFETAESHAEDTFISLELVPSCKQVLEAFLANCNQLAHDLGWKIDQSKTTLTGFWAHITEPGNSTAPHRHLSYHKINHFSGVYYVQAPKGCGDIYFIDDRLVRGYEPNPQSAVYQGFYVTDGMMVMFPSWLTHRVGVNESGDTRVSISFNANITPC